MNASNSSVLDTVNDLIQTCKDGQEGFRDAAEHVKDSDLKSLLSAFSLQRSGFAGELQSEAHTLGEKNPANASTVGGALHRGWINLKAAIAGNDEHEILAECERGEDVAVSVYKGALEDDGLPANLRTLIERQYSEIIATHDRVKQLRDRSA